MGEESIEFISEQRTFTGIMNSQYYLYCSCTFVLKFYTTTGFQGGGKSILTYVPLWDSCTDKARVTLGSSVSILRTCFQGIITHEASLTDALRVISEYSSIRSRRVSHQKYFPGRPIKYNFKQQTLTAGKHCSINGGILLIDTERF